jgi:hypothetical protein
VKEVNEFENSLNIAKTDFITLQLYDYHQEFKYRSLFSGTRMPMTYYCHDLIVDYYLRPGHSNYANKELVIDANYRLTNLGKEKYYFLEGDYERTTMGTLAFWFLRKQERVRQSQEIINRSKNVDWQTLNKYYPDYRDLIIDNVYKNLLNKGKTSIDEMIKDRNWDKFYINSRKYISDMDKSQVSMVGSSFERFPYFLVLEQSKPSKILRDYSELINLILTNFYSKYRLNPIFMLPALRNRPLDISNMALTEGSGIMDRSREALGQPPLSLFWMFVYDIKKLLLVEALNLIEKIYKVPFIDPIRYDDFYYRFTHYKDGLYIFGDNGMLIKKGEIITIYDLSLSDVAQGFIRRNHGDNFCFFVRLNGDYDCGSTGDCLTTLWNIEGQIYIWRLFFDGYLSTRKEWPEIEKLAEETDTFLGHCWSEVLNDWFNKGIRLTTDSAKRAIPTYYQRGHVNRLEWEPKKQINRNEFLSLAISSGMIDMKLTEFYEWVERNKIKIFDEELGLHERIAQADQVPGFLDLSDADLDHLAIPYKLTGGEIYD